MHRENSQGSLMSQTYGQYLGVDLNLIGVKRGPPIDILCSKYDWLLISAML